MPSPTATPNLLSTLRERQRTLIGEAEATASAAAVAQRGLTDDEKTRDDTIYADLQTLAGDIDREERRLQYVQTVPPVGAWDGQGRPQEVTEPNELRAASGSRLLAHDLAADAPWGYASYGMTAESFLRQHPGTAGLPATDSRHPLAVYGAAADGEFLQAVYRANTGQGIDARLNYVSAAQGAGRAVGPDGGFLVGATMQDRIKLRMAQGRIFSRLSPIPLDEGTDGLEINVVDETSRVAGSRHGGVRGYWVDEGTAATASRPRLRKYNLRVKGLAALGYATNNLLRNAAALGSLMTTAFGDELRFLVEDSVINGTGAGQPLGLLTAGCLISVAKETGQAATTVVYENPIKMWPRLLPDLRAGAVWLIHSDVEPQLDALSLTVGTGALEPRFIGYSREGVLTIKGRPVLPVEYCATLGTVGDIILANFDEYGFIEVPIEQASSMHVAFTTNEMCFRVTYYVDGAPYMRAALDPFKGTTTQSSCVALDTRS